MADWFGEGSDGNPSRVANVWSMAALCILGPVFLLLSYSSVCPVFDAPGLSDAMNYTLLSYGNDKRIMRASSNARPVYALDCLLISKHVTMLLVFSKATPKNLLHELFPYYITDPGT